MLETLSLMNEEHHVLFCCLIGLLAAEADVTGFVRRAEALLEDLDGHFRNEERAMRAFAYPHYERHRAEHARLLNAAAARLSAIAESATPGGCREFVELLRTRLLSHMRNDDARLSMFLACWEDAAREPSTIAELPA